MTNGTAEGLAGAKDRLIRDLAAEIEDPRVVEAMASVPREDFVPDELRHAAYDNSPLPIGYGQTISQPLMVAMMTQALQLSGDERVLEIGTGSGYQTAILSLLSEHVVSVEVVEELARQAADRLPRLGYSNVEVHVAEQELGRPQNGPYNGIIVTAAAPEIPLELLEQLSMYGRLVIPVGGRDLQELVRIVRTPEGAERRHLGPCRFVPLVGRSAWPVGGF